MPGGDDLPTDALEDVAYLARSANRVQILDALAEGAHSRREVADLTGVSRTTLDRIVNELEERGWARRTSAGTYEATPQGALLMERFRPFLDAVAALRTLDDAVTWLPEDLPVGLEHFRDATVRRPAAGDPVETVEFMTDLLADASTFRVLTHLVAPGTIEVGMAEAVLGGDLTLEAVVTDPALEYVATRPERADRWRAIVEAGADVYRTDGPIPCNLWIADETVLLKESGPGPIDESYGAPIVTDDATVRAWANDLLEEWVADATRVTADAFGADAASTDDPVE